VHRATQLAAQLAELRLEPENLGREVPVLVAARAEQPLQLLGSSGHGDARQDRRELGGARRRLPVRANEPFREMPDQLAKPLSGRHTEVRLRQAPGHA
jgi:hypothetical protein